MFMEEFGSEERDTNKRLTGEFFISDGWDFGLCRAHYRRKIPHDYKIQRPSDCTDYMLDLDKPIPEMLSSLGSSDSNAIQDYIISLRFSKKGEIDFTRHTTTRILLSIYYKCAFGYTKIIPDGLLLFQRVQFSGCRGSSQCLQQAKWIPALG